MRKFFVVLFFLICSTSKIFANAAAPGFYNNGGSSDFIPFFASDSSYLDKIQMQSEQITVLLYPNFAVVRGEYNMLNLSNKEISSIVTKRNEMQQLHYLGLPLRVNYTIYSKNSFEWYAGGGFKVDKCIYAKSGATVLKESDFLLSALLTTGIQYKITRNLSIYFEPYCSYLFSDTRLPSYRSENPLEISAKLGIRVNL